MRENIGDKIVDRVKERFYLVRDKIRSDYKSTRPFRQPKIPDRELLYNYQKLTAQQRAMYRQSFGEVWGLYEDKMRKLQNKYMGGTQ